jgi:hypothetical protein
MNAIDTLRREFEKQLATPSLKQMAQERGARGDTILHARVMGKHRCSSFGDSGGGSHQ